ncbi:GIN domain-containing protein [Bacteroides helcogenes]|uniref:Putative auto-transporter adhesin head GIN domain-containing protein n=1 Tax=Bacteroides helcogenes (strain ATCC 35417 / DSM 20613 / JCM 6297 / CCUG 15421 / P 36-108) TaxID=693979 RepID=E6SRF0_BACT6|nr:DUF2807 domain-containing protein [Bacteroides helcogenes]ADV44053.1 hypothetical protein Bache_2082 [Bacteroides helcogenes P 36-108]MDY5237876.1 DUF2807 domain-containing protein [Bacteroides helcogenes]
MNTNVIGIIIALLLAFAGGALAQDAKVSEIRKVDNFSSIEVVSVATVYFTQSDTYSLKIEGKEKYVKTTTTSVSNGILTIGIKDGDKEVRNRKEGVTIYLTAPDLKNVEFTGVGSFNCEKPLKLNAVKFQIEGVGKVNVKDLTCRTLKVELDGVGKAAINVDCDYLSADVDGVGSVTLSGTAGKADISKDGIGRVNTRNLKVGR